MIKARIESEFRSQDALLWLGGYCALPLVLIVLALLLLSGCSELQRDPPIEVWDDMKRQGKFHGRKMRMNMFSGSTRDSRVPPEGTVARGHMTERHAVLTPGWRAICTSARIPVPMSPCAADIKGQTKFNTYCTPCHDQTGHRGRELCRSRCPPGSPRI